MKNEKLTAQQILEELIERYPTLEVCRKDIMLAFDAMVDSYSHGGKLLVAGNGGSSSDSDHIVGELMKSFRVQRKIDYECAEKLKKEFGEVGAHVADSMEGALPAISLPTISGLSTAYSNDRDPQIVFSQMIYGYGCKDDVFLGISTSGNSQNVIYGLMVARAKGLCSIVLTGESGGKCVSYADICIRVPDTRTFAIQEYHLPIYHALCAMLEAHFFLE